MLLIVDLLNKLHSVQVQELNHCKLFHVLKLMQTKEQEELVVSLQVSVLDCIQPGHTTMNWKILLYLKYRELILVM